MLTIFKKFFGKAQTKSAETLVPASPTPSPAQVQFESAIQMAKVEVAKLSLSAIVAKLPSDLRDLIANAPNETTTVALPIQTIMKQLPSGVVRMSLASLHRQAPAGIFKPLPTGDKRMVEIPLAEVFKHVKPTAFKRRTDQRTVEVKDEDLAAPVFNDRNKPKDAEPTTPVKKSKPAPSTPEASASKHLESAAPAPAAMRVVAPPSDLKLATPPPLGAAAATEPTPAPAKSIEPTSGRTVLTLPLAKISADWPEPIRSALASLDPATTVALPHADLAPGLARGKIACTWSQICEWLTPPAPDTFELDAATALILPLKVIAPAFLALSKKPATPRKSVEIDETIPALFTGGQSKPAVNVPVPTAELVTPESTAVETPAAEVTGSRDSEISEETAITETPKLETVTTEAPNTATAVSETQVAEAPADKAPAAETPAVEAPAANIPVETPAGTAATEPPSRVGAAFGEPEKTTWTPAELIARVVKLPGVAGAVVALQEGFQVAHALPDGVNAETISAFLPQIFGRLNQYAGEMKLGEVDDLLFTTRGAHCLIYRLGAVYFAVLGQPGASLPWNELRLVAAELSRQDSK